MSADPVSRPWRRFLRFSVRGLIVLVLVVGAWGGWIVRGARVEREAVTVIEKAGGKVRPDVRKLSGLRVECNGCIDGTGWTVSHDYRGSVSINRPLATRGSCTLEGAGPNSPTSTSATPKSPTPG